MDHDEVMVKGLSVDAPNVSIAQVFGLPRTGAEFPLHEDVVAAIEEFYE